MRDGRGRVTPHWRCAQGGRRVHRRRCPGTVLEPCSAGQRIAWMAPAPVAGAAGAASCDVRSELAFLQESVPRPWKMTTSTRCTASNRRIPVSHP